MVMIAVIVTMLAMSVVVVSMVLARVMIRRRNGGADRGGTVHVAQRVDEGARP